MSFKASNNLREIALSFFYDVGLHSGLRKKNCGLGSHATIFTRIKYLKLWFHGEDNDISIKTFT